MIQLEDHDRGVILPVRAQAGARANALRGEQNGALKVAVTQIAEKGKANKAIIQLLCKKLGLRRSQMELLAGSTSSQKKMLVRETSRAELAEKIRVSLERE